MKLFESLINVATSAALLLMPMPAEAAPTTCWLQFPSETTGAKPQQCDLQHSRNAQGLNITHLTTISDGETAHIVLWSTSDGKPSYAEVNLPTGENQRNTFVFQYRIDKDGDVHLRHQSTGMSIWWTPLSKAQPAATPPAFSGGVTA